MAVRIQNSNSMNFGTFGTQAVVSHIRAKTAGGMVIGTKQLTSPVTIAANRSAEFVVGAIDFVFAKGQLEDAGLQDILNNYFDSADTEIELLTDSATEVAVSGYSSQTTRSWTYSTEND